MDGDDDNQPWIRHLPKKGGHAIIAAHYSPTPINKAPITQPTTVPYGHHDTDNRLSHRPANHLKVKKPLAYIHVRHSQNARTHKITTQTANVQTLKRHRTAPYQRSQPAIKSRHWVATSRVKLRPQTLIFHRPKTQLISRQFAIQAITTGIRGQHFQNDGRAIKEFASFWWEFTQAPSIIKRLHHGKLLIYQDYNKGKVLLITNEQAISRQKCTNNKHKLESI